MTSTALRISTVRSLAQLEALGPAYERFLERCPGGFGLFCTPMWVRHLSTVYLRPSQSLYFLLAWRNDELVGLAPWAIDRKGWSRAKVRRLFCWGGITGSLRLEGSLLVQDPSDAPACAEAFARHIRTSQPREIDHIDLGYLSEHAPGRVALGQALGLGLGPAEDMPGYILDLPDNVEAFQASLKKSTFASVRASLRQLERHGARIEVKPALSGQELEQLIDIHVQRQAAHEGKGQSRHSIFELSGERNAYLALLQEAQERGITRYFLISEGDRLKAFALCFAWGDTLFFQLTAFDPDYGKFSPGRVLMYEKAMHAIGVDRLQHIYMWPGTTKVKTDFANRIYTCHPLQGTNSGSVQSSIKCVIWHALSRLTQRGRG